MDGLQSVRRADFLTTSPGGWLIFLILLEFVVVKKLTHLLAEKVRFKPNFVVKHIQNRYHAPLVGSNHKFR